MPIAVTLFEHDELYTIVAFYNVNPAINNIIISRDVIHKMKSIAIISTKMHTKLAFNL